MEGTKPSSVAPSVEGGFDLMVSPPAKTITSLIPLSQEMLERFLTASSCDKDVISYVECRAHIILQAIFPDEREEDILIYKSLRLYYSVLEVVCRGKGAKTLHAILTDEMLHRCMLACAASVEILLITVSSTETKLFPAQVLERSGITAFDLSNTIIGCFIRHEESLPGQFRRHLNLFKEQLLESMVWKKGSSLYNSLAVARPSLSAEINRLGLFAEPMPSVDEIATHINSSCGGGLPPVPSLPKLELETSPSKGGGVETCAETEINNFFREIIMLGAVRIHGMVERLLLSQQTRENVYCLFQRILNEQTSVFFNRHIDQIILCCFYGVAKLSKLNLTFREIIHSYKEQPQCRPHVYHRVFVDCPLARHGGASTSRTGQEHVDMITFYNDIFIPSVRPLVLELGAGGATVKSDQIAEVDNRNDGLVAQCLGSPKILPFPRLPNMSREKVYGAHNLRISPLQSSEIIMLGAVRINRMVEKLQLSQQIGEKVDCLFQRILNQLSFLFDIHIDQIILCCFHGVTEDLTFEEIIQSYRRQPQYEPPVFLSEFVDWPLARRYWPYEKRIGQAHVDDIFNFYTDIFIPNVKPLLSELGTGGTTVKSDQIAEFNNENYGQSPGSPKILPFPSLPVMSPEEVSATHYVCVSPLGSSEIIMLGAVRISSMVEMLQLSQQMRENVYRLFQRILHQQTSLFFNHHIDQIILCCFCGVAKISKLNLTFGEIIDSYRKQPQCNPRVFDRVFVDWSLACQGWASNKGTGQEHVDIVTFYNDIFFPCVKPLLLELGAGGATVKSDRKRKFNLKMMAVPTRLPSI